MKRLAVLASVLLAAIARAGPIYVSTWPERLVVSGGVTLHPTPEQCRAAGLELTINKPPPSADEIAAAQAASIATQAALAASLASELAAIQAHTNMVLALRQKYRITTKSLCCEAGITETNVLTASQIEALFSLLDDVDSSNKIKRNGKVQAYIIQLFWLTYMLEKEDGKNALDAI